MRGSGALVPVRHPSIKRSPSHHEFVSYPRHAIHRGTFPLKHSRSPRLVTLHIISASLQLQACITCMASSSDVGQGNGVLRTDMLPGHETKLSPQPPSYHPTPTRFKNSVSSPEQLEVTHASIQLPWTPNTPTLNLLVTLLLTTFIILDIFF